MWWQSHHSSLRYSRSVTVQRRRQGQITPTVAVVLVSRAPRVSSTTCGLSAILTVHCVQKWVFQVSFVIPTRGGVRSHTHGRRALGLPASFHSMPCSDSRQASRFPSPYPTWCVRACQSIHLREFCLPVTCNACPSMWRSHRTRERDERRKASPPGRAQ